MNIIKPVNDYTVHGRPVAYARLRAIDDEQGIVICDLLDTADRVLAADRYFHFDKRPFEISSSDREALGVSPSPPGLPASSTGDVLPGPDDSWNKGDIQAWFEAQEIPYSKKATKPDLLEIVKLRGQSDGTE